MKLFGRYVFGQVAGALMLILSSLTGVVWIATALKQLNVVTSQGGQTLQFLQMTMLAIPNLIAIIAPVALLIASLHVLNRLNTDSELIVMTASGATVWSFARPILALATFVAGAVLITNVWIMPYTARQFADQVLELRTDLIGQVIQPGNFSSPENGLAFHIRDRDQRTGRLLGLVMHDGRDKAQQITYLAEHGDIIKHGKSAFLIMDTGHIIRQTSASEAPQIIQFDRYAIDLMRFEPREGPTEPRPRERTISDLWNIRPDYKSERGISYGKIRAELHDRFSSALYPLAFAMIAIAGLGIAQTTRQSRTKNLVAAFAAAITLRITGFAAINLFSLKPWAITLVYGLPIAGFVAAAMVAARRSRPRRAGAIARTVEGLNGAIASHLAALWRPRRARQT